jgi:hypothetical protein
MGLNEIAVAANVTAQAVSNWRARSNFPEPLTTLASGPIWDGRIVRTWLKHAGKTSSSAIREDKLNDFVVGGEYTHMQIVDAIGGETVSYLPQSNGRIVGGRFKVDKMNPEAPQRIIVGDVPRVVKKAELLANQEGSIPVFLKKASNRWLFHGFMRCTGFDISDDAKRNTPGIEQRKENIAGILTLEKLP